MSRKRKGFVKLSGAAGPAPPMVVAQRAVASFALGYFDCAYLINRDRDTERLAKMSARLGRLGVPFERFAAVEARGDERLFPCKPQLTPGYFACTRSHLAVLRTAMDRGQERVIVLEDDAVFRDDTAERMARIVPQLRGMEWDVFYFGLHLLEAHRRVSEDLAIVKRSFHAHAYAVSRRAMPAMIEIIEAAMRLGFHFDCHEMAGRPPLVRVYADPILAVQEPNMSGVLGERVDRLGQYFPPFDRGEFFAHCAEARSWQKSGESGVGDVLGSGVLGVGSGEVGEVQHPLSGSMPLAASRTAHPRPDPLTTPKTPSLTLPRSTEGGDNAASRTAHPQPPDPLTIPKTPSLTLARSTEGGDQASTERMNTTTKPANPLLREAKRHHKANRLAEAGRLYRTALEREPEDAEANYLLGLLEHQLGHSAAAVELLYKALAFRPDCAEYSGKLGMALASVGRGEEALEALDRAVELEAGLAEAHYNRGVVLDRLGRGDEALTAWRQAVALRPGYDDALCMLGQKLLALNDTDAALVHLREAVRVNPRHAAAQNNLGIGLRKAGDSAAAAGHFRRAAVLRPGFAEAHSNLGTALNELGKPEEALGHLEKAAELRPDFVDALWNLALSLLSLGQFDRGWLEYEWRRHLPADAALHRPFRQPEWNGCNISGGTLLVVCEQGLGDTLQFIRYVPLLARRGAKVVVECQPPLRELLATVEGAAQVVARGEPLPRFDAHVRLMSLPSMLGTRLGNVPVDGPYLRADETRVEEWRRRLETSGQTSTPGQSGVGGCDGANGHPRRAAPDSPRAVGDSSGIGSEVDCAAGETVRGADPTQAGEGTSFSGIACETLSASLIRTVPAVNAPQAGPLNNAIPEPSADPGPAAPCIAQALQPGATAGTAVPRLFRIGIAWQGNPTFPNDRERSVPLLHFAPLAAVPGVRLYSLQKNQGVEQLPEVRKHFAVSDFSPPLDEGCGAFVDTAAVIANLDLVISSDTSMVHLAGALGVRVWMATSFACDWRWLRDRDDCPWYPTLRLFRQPCRGDWPAVFARMADALRETLASPDSRKKEHVPAMVPIAPGELIDRLTILQIKTERISDPAKLRGIRAELEALRAARERSLPASEQIDGLARELKAVNEALWDIEDNIRLCDRAGDFGPRFTELACSVYRTNDRRADLKRQVNAMLGSRLGDEKQYEAYD
jgi:tetratricopeptide (TPR) repeat protein